MYGTVKCLPVSRRNSISPRLPEPVEVVDERRRVIARREVQEPLQLAADPRHVPLERLAIEQVPFRGSSRWVADHAGPASHEGDRTAPEALQAEQPEDRHEVTDVERGARRIESDVTADPRVARKAGRQAGRRRVQDPAPFELVEQSAGTRRGRVRHRPVRRAVSTSGRGDLRSITPPMLSCGLRCRPVSRGASAIDVRSSANRKDGPARPSVGSSSSSLSSLSQPAASSRGVASSLPWAPTTTTPRVSPTRSRP